MSDPIHYRPNKSVQRGLCGAAGWLDLFNPTGRIKPPRLTVQPGRVTCSDCKTNLSTVS